MKLLSLALALVMGIIAPALAQGPIGTVERGLYQCELPGDAARPAGIAQPELDFRIRSASRYSTVDGRGTYLRRGDVMTFTSGPRQGEHYKVVSQRFMRRMEGGEPGRLRCIRAPRHFTL